MIRASLGRDRWNMCYFNLSHPASGVPIVIEVWWTIKIWREIAETCFDEQAGGWGGGGRSEDTKVFVRSNKIKMSTSERHLRSSILEIKLERQSWDGLYVCRKDVVKQDMWGLVWHWRTLAIGWGGERLSAVTTTEGSSQKKQKK